MSDLQEAVDALTKPIIEHIAQKDDDGKWLKAHTVEHKALLDQLCDAVHPSSNTDTGSASAVSSRSPINGDAMFEYAKISGQIGDWCNMVGIRPTRYPIPDLLAWHAHVLTLGDWDASFYVRQLRTWANLIRGKLDPPKRIELTISCPVCGQREWPGENGEGALFPVVVEYRRPEEGASIKPNALCRACKTVWQGIDAVEELAEEVSERNAESA